MTVYFKGYEIPDEVYRDLKASGQSPCLCAGCGLLWTTRNIRKETFCPECARKAPMLKKYTNKGYHPNQQERQQIFSGNWRAN